MCGLGVRANLWAAGDFHLDLVDAARARFNVLKPVPALSLEPELACIPNPGTSFGRAHRPLEPRLGWSTVCLGIARPHRACWNQKFAFCLWAASSGTRNQARALAWNPGTSSNLAWNRNLEPASTRYRLHRCMHERRPSQLGIPQSSDQVCFPPFCIREV